MVKALFDTNILIDYLNGLPAARAELGRYGDKAISIVTWMELLVGATPTTEAVIRAFLGSFEIVMLDDRIAEHAVTSRKSLKMKLPDAIIWASAQTNGMLLVTRNVKDFPAQSPGVRMPYRV
jgi:predicted nucleic acid-binding protein